MENRPAGHDCAVASPVQFQLLGRIDSSLVLLVLLFKVILFLARSAVRLAIATLQFREGMLSTWALVTAAKAPSSIKTGAHRFMLHIFSVK